MSNSQDRYAVFDALLITLKASIADFKKVAVETAISAFDHFESEDRDLRPAQRLFDLLREDDATFVHANNFARWMLRNSPTAYDTDAKHFSLDKDEEANPFNRKQAVEVNFFKQSKLDAIAAVYDKASILEKVNKSLTAFDNAKKWVGRNPDSERVLALVKSHLAQLPVIVAGIFDDYDKARRDDVMNGASEEEDEVLEGEIMDEPLPRLPPPAPDQPQAAVGGTDQ